MDIFSGVGFNIYLAGLIGFVFIIWSILRLISKCYIKAAPNEAVVVYGRGKKTADGKIAFSDIYTSGGRIVWPVIEGYAKLMLNVMQIELLVEDVPSANGVKVTVKGTANIKIKSDPASLHAGAERFLNMPMEMIREIGYKNLEGHLRSIISQMTVESILQNRQEFNGKIMEEVTTDLGKLGLGIDFLTIQEVTDTEGYMDALGEKKTAEVKRDATIGRAEAESEAKQRASDATRAAETVATENEAKVAEAQKEMNIKKARYNAEVAKENAYAEQAGPLATAEKEKEVVIAKQTVEKVRQEEAAKVAQAKAAATEEELKASMIKPAEADKQKQIIEAERDKQRSVITAEAEKQKKIITAEADKEKLLREAEGEAEKVRKMATAEAESIRLKANAQAEATTAIGAAEASAIQAKAEAYEKLDEVGRSLQLIEAAGKVVPDIIKELSGVAKEIAAPIANVDKIEIVDFGGEGKGVNSMAKIVPSVLKEMISGLKALDIDPQELLHKIGLKEAMVESSKQNITPQLEAKNVEEVPETKM